MIASSDLHKKYLCDRYLILKDSRFKLGPKHVTADICYDYTEIRLNPIGPGGGLRAPDNQIHSCRSETSKSIMPKLCDLVFIFKTCSDQILAKLINRRGGVAAALLSSRLLKNFGNKKICLCLKVAKIGMGGNFGSRRTILEIRTHFFKVKPIFLR